MAKQAPIHALRANLETARLKAVQELAATEFPYSTDVLHRLASLQAALTAVSESIAMQEPALGGGSSEGLD
jgi:hypothetical protein